MRKGRWRRGGGYGRGLKVVDMDLGKGGALTVGNNGRGVWEESKAAVEWNGRVEWSGVEWKCGVGWKESSKMD